MSFVRSLILPLVLCVGTASALAAEPVFGWGRKPIKSGGLSGKANGAHVLPDAGDYTEYWSHAFLFKSGHAVFARFVMTNLGLGGTKAAVQGHLVTPDGEVHELIDGRRDKDSWTYGSSNLSFSLAKHSLSGDGSSFSLKLANDAGTSVSITFNNVLPGYKPGKLLYGEAKSDFLDFAVTSPRAAAQGSFTVGGQTVTSEGLGYADHFHTNFAQHKQIQTWITLAAFTDTVSLNLTNLITTKNFGGKRLSFLAVGHGDKVALTSNRVTVSQSKFWTDGKSKAKYRVPRRFSLSYSDKKSGDFIKAKVEVIKRLHRFDVLKNLQSFERFVVERIAQPMQYRFKVKLTMTGKLGNDAINSTGEGVVEVIHINRAK